MKRKIKVRNPMAKVLHGGNYTPKTILSKKRKLDRKRKHKHGD